MLVPGLVDKDVTVPVALPLLRQVAPLRLTSLETHLALKKSILADLSEWFDGELLLKLFLDLYLEFSPEALGLHGFVRHVDLLNPRVVELEPLCKDGVS